MFYSFIKKTPKTQNNSATSFSDEKISNLWTAAVMYFPLEICVQVQLNAKISIADFLDGSSPF